MVFARASTVVDIRVLDTMTTEIRYFRSVAFPPESHAEGVWQAACPHPACEGKLMISNA